MRQKLTDLAIRKLPYEPKGNKKYWDTTTQGFGVRVTAASKSFFVMYGKERTLRTIGKFPEISLSYARREAMGYLSSLPAKKPLLSDLSAAREQYLIECEAKNRPATVKQYRHFLRQLPNKKLLDVQKSDIDISSQHAVMAWRVFFNWCIRNELVDRNPFAHVSVRWASRSRVLTDDEVRKLWEYNFAPYSDYIKLLFLTGQRNGQFSDFAMQGDILIFPESIMKNRREHTIPLTEWTASILTGLVPFNGWSRAKRRIDEHTGVSDWVHHDARRYFSTTMASLQVPLHVTEAILSHSSGQVSGVAATYNRYNYLIEMRDALCVYEAHLRSILERT